VDHRCVPTCPVFSCAGGHRDLHSFPTRRSSDLTALVESLRAAPDDPMTLFAVPDGVTALREVVRELRCLEWVRKNAKELDGDARSEEHTSELQSRENLVCRLLLETKNKEQSSQK